MNEKNHKLQENIKLYTQARDLYNRLDKVEDDFSKFEAKPDDLDTIRLALITRGIVLRRMITKESGGEIIWE